MPRHVRATRNLLDRPAVPARRVEDTRPASGKVLVIGAGQGGLLVTAQLITEVSANVVGILDDDPTKTGMSLHSVPVLGPATRLPELARELAIDVIAIAIPGAGGREMNRLLGLAQQASQRRGTQAASLRTLVLPSIREARSGGPGMRLRPPVPADIVERGPDSGPRSEEARRFPVARSTVLVTGAAGSVGSELCRRLLERGFGWVIGLDSDESGLVEMERSMAAQRSGVVLPVLADVADRPKISQVFRRHRPDVVFHTAALTSREAAEEYPDTAVSTNVLGALSVCVAAQSEGCGRLVLVSDSPPQGPRAPMAPETIYELTRRAREMIVRSHYPRIPVSSVVRFGNVIGGRSPMLQELISRLAQAHPMQVVQPEDAISTMTVSEAVELTIEAGLCSQRNEVFAVDTSEYIGLQELLDRLRWILGVHDTPPISDDGVSWSSLNPALPAARLGRPGGSRTSFHPLLFCESDELDVPFAAVYDRVMPILEAAERGHPEEIRQLLSELAAIAPEVEAQAPRFRNSRKSRSVASRN